MVCHFFITNFDTNVSSGELEKQQENESFWLAIFQTKNFLFII